MGFWIFKSAREKALDQIYKRLSGIETIMKGDVEDEDLAEALDRLEHIEKLLVPPEPKAGPQEGGKIPGEVVDAVLQIVPPEYRGLAEKFIRPVMNNPDTVRETINKLLSNPAVQKFVAPAKAGQQAGIPAIPPELMQPYAPRQDQSQPVHN